MSLEAKVEALTQAIQALTTQLQSAKAPTPVVQLAAAAPVPTNPVLSQSQSAAPLMPAPPTFMTPAAAPVVSGAPFTDSRGLIEYVMGAYKAMGPQKGAQIQGVLTGLGYQNINDVKPEHYGALFHGIESLKG